MNKLLWFTGLVCLLWTFGSITAQENTIVNKFDVDDLNHQVTQTVSLSGVLKFNVEINGISDNINVTSAASAQNEAAMAVNPNDVANIVIAMNDYGKGQNGLSGQSVAVSKDGGSTWVMRPVPVTGPNLHAIDPAILYTNDGTVYLAYAAIRMINKFTVGSAIYLTSSRDGGLTWSEPVAVADGLNNAMAVYSRPCLAVNPVNQNVVIGWIKNEGSANRATAFITKRNINGSFQEPLAINTLPARARNLSIASNRNGELFAAWYDVVSHSARVSRIVNTTVTEVAAFAVNPIGGTDGTSRLLKQNLKVNNYPVLAVDQSNGTYSGSVYVVWTSQIGDSPEILMATSSDNGYTWSSPKVVNQNTLNDQFFPAVSVDNVSGTVNIIYYDSRKDANNQLIDLYLSQSYDGGQTFVDIRLSNESFDPSVGPFAGKVIGDYNAVVSLNNTVYTAWADTRSGNDQDVYFGKIRSEAGQKVDRFVLNQNYPNPFNPATQISYQINKETHVTLTVYNALGQLIKTLVNERQKAGNYTLHFNASELSSGIYFYRLQAGDAVSVKKMMLVK